MAGHCSHLHGTEFPFKLVILSQSSLKTLKAFCLPGFLLGKGKDLDNYFQREFW